LVNVVLEAYLKGVSTRKVDGLVKALGLDGMGKDEVSRIARELDESVRLFRERPLTGFYPYLWLDATYIRSRENGRVVNTALVVAVAVNQEGKREVLGFDMGPSEDAEFWTSFLRSLVQRGLRRVKPVISDAHVGLRQAIQTVLQNASWQRCRVHLARNVLVHVSKGAQSEVADHVRSIFEAPDADTARARLREVVEKLESRFPKAAKVLEEAEADALAFMAFPAERGGGYSRRTFWRD
jgi:putative transposase